jgi:hypothetical protein
MEAGVLHFAGSSSGMVVLLAGVSMMPGAIALIVIPLRLTSAAVNSVGKPTAALEVCHGSDSPR